MSAERAPSHIEPSSNPASTFARLVAALVDGGALTILSVPVVVLLANSSVAARDSRWTWTLTAAALGAVYFIALTTWRGQTLGKQLLGVIVVDERSEPPTVRAAAVRYVALTLVPLNLVFGAVVGLWSLAIIFSMTTHPERRGWHDRLAGTRVVDVAARPPLPSRIGPRTSVDLIAIAEPPTGNPRKHRRRR